jgi:hypothetical protein
MNRLFFLYIFLFISVLSLNAQVAADALRYSSLEVGGTARTVAIGGGIGALGADFSVINTNPAGIAAFRRSEFTMTPSLYSINTDATLDGSNSPATSEDKRSFSFNNLGLVFARQGRSANWRTSNIAIGLNRIANFSQTIHYQGATRGSHIDFFQEEAGDLAPDALNDFTTGLAWDVGALYQDPAEGTDFWETDVELNENALIDKEQTIQRSGSINELSFAMAWNYKERLMIGFAAGFPLLSYKEEKVYQEEDTADEIEAFRSMQFDESLKTTGAGINLKLGAILRLNQMVRLGAAVHTPTAYTLTDKYSTKILHNFVDNNNDGTLESASPESEFEYNLSTPWRFIGSAGFIIKKQGFLTAEVEYVNYGSASFDLTQNDNSAETATFQENLNNEIDRNYQSAINLHFGGEFAYKVLRFRGGIKLSGTALAGENITDNTYSLGIGFRQKKFFVDAAYRFADRSGSFEPYSVPDFYPQNSVSTNMTPNSILLTLGFKF